LQGQRAVLTSSKAVVVAEVMILLTLMSAEPLAAQGVEQAVVVVVVGLAVIQAAAR
jgi:hypothetical protein